MSDMKYQEYKCSTCGAKDEAKLFQNESTPPVVNCWKCGQGYNMKISDMLMKYKGMFPVIHA